MTKTIHLDPTFDRFFPLDGKSIEDFGLHRAALVTSYGLYRRQGNAYVYDQIDFPTCERVAKGMTPGRMIILDEEMLDAHSPDLPYRDHVHDQLIQAVEIYRAANPGTAIGYYAKLPRRDYWNCMAGIHNPQHAGYLKWIEENAQFKSNIEDSTLKRNARGLADVVDRVFPSLYYWYPLPQNMENWKYYAAKNIEEAAKYGKPIYPYLTANQITTGYPTWPDGIFAEMLRFVLSMECVSGVVLFNHDPAEDIQSTNWWQQILEVNGEL